MKIANIFFMLIMFFFSKIAICNDSNLILKGVVNEPACTVDINDVDKTVSLGNWATKQLRTFSSTTQLVDFSINLTGCTASGVTLAFMGSKNNTDNTLLALSDDSTAAGVAVEILDITHKRIEIGSNAPRVIVDGNGDAVLRFTARYVAVGTPVSGTANADTNFTLSYD